MSYWRGLCTLMWALVPMLILSCAGGGAIDSEIAMIAAPQSPASTPVATTAPVTLPTATPAPTLAPVVSPAAEVSLDIGPIEVPTAEPAATSEPTPVPQPTAEPTATSEPTPIPQPTAEPTATSEPTPVPQPTAEPTATSEPTPVPQPTAKPTATSEPTPLPQPTGHVVVDVGYATLGQAGATTLRLPAARIELIGFHEASHPGAQAINAAGSGVEMMTLASRGRGTPATSAADIVVPPGEVVRAPVTGTVVAAATFVLYCEHQDKLVYIEPDGLPGWQVRLFHVTGDIPAVGDRVIAGETVVADGATMLPFESQIDEFTAEPSWPHVHLEVVDTSVPDDRPPGGGC